MIGVALEGGGARGSYQIGAIKALKKCGIEPVCYVGTSIGSVNAALAASGDIKRMERIWRGMSSEELFNIDANLLKAIEEKRINKSILKKGFKTVVDIIKNAGIDTKKLRKVYKEYLDEEALRNSNIDFGLVTYSLTDRKPVEIFLRDIPKGKVYEYLIASCYLPVFKMEKIIDDKYYLDGGFHDNCPINMLLREGYDEIYAIGLNSLGNKQDLIKNNAKIVRIAPKKDLGSMLIFNEKSVRENAELGFYDTLKVLKNLDGHTYYIKNKNHKYYERITQDIDYMELHMLDNVTTDVKKLTIRVFERLMKEFGLEVYKVYSVPMLVIKLKGLLYDKPDHKYYNFVKNLKILF